MKKETDLLIEDFLALTEKIYRRLCDIHSYVPRSLIESRDRVLKELCARGEAEWLLGLQHPGHLGPIWESMADLEYDLAHLTV